MKYVFFILTSILVSCSPQTEEPAELEYISIRIEKELKKINASLKEYAQEYDGKHDSNNITDLLENICKSDYNIRAASFVDCNGVLMYSLPSMSDVYGLDISYQEHVQYVLKNKKPVLSKQFRAVQGFNAITIDQPVIKSDTLNSIFAVLLSPQYMFDEIIKDYPNLDSCDVWVIEKDGTIIYDSDIEEIGRNIYQDQEYKKLSHFDLLIDSIDNLEKGVITYSPKESCRHKVAWETYSYLNMEWIIVLEFPIDKPIIRRIPSELGIRNSEESLIELSENELFQSFLWNDDQQSVQEMMKNFYDYCPGIFSIQWIDSNAVNRCGFPMHNVNYLGYQGNTKSLNPNILNAISKKSIQEFDEYIANDYIASFYTVPVYYENKYLGLIYYNKLSVK